MDFIYLWTFYHCIHFFIHSRINSSINSYFPFLLFVLLQISKRFLRQMAQPFDRVSLPIFTLISALERFLYEWELTVRTTALLMAIYFCRERFVVYEYFIADLPQLKCATYDM